jgi:hypothetical protein
VGLDVFQVSGINSFSIHWVVKKTDPTIPPDEIAPESCNFVIAKESTGLSGGGGVNAPYTHFLFTHVLDPTPSCLQLLTDFPATAYHHR